MYAVIAENRLSGSITIITTMTVKTTMMKIYGEKTTPRISTVIACITDKSGD